MGKFEDRQRQYHEVDEPKARLRHIAVGIRKKFADEFDFGDLPDEEVIRRHYSRFGQGMAPEAYSKRLDETYGKSYEAPEEPTPTMGERVEQGVEVAKEVGKGLIPFAVAPAVQVGTALAGAGKAAAAIGAKAPVVGSIASAGAHAINAMTQAVTAQKLSETAAGVAPIDVDAKAQEFYAKLAPSLEGMGYSPEQVMGEARRRALNVSRGQQQTVESIDQQVEQTQREAMLEPVKAATDAFFFGFGTPQLTGALGGALAKLGLTKAAGAAGAAATTAAPTLSQVGKHVAVGAGLGAPGMALQEGADRAVTAASQNKPLPEVVQELVAGAKHGGKVGAIGGAILGGGVGALEQGVGAAARAISRRRIAAEFRETKAQAELDDARLRGWRDVVASSAKSVVARDVERAARVDQSTRALIQKTADNFDPHNSKYDVTGDPADVATTIVQAEAGDAAALSEAGLRAASAIEERIRLFQDANRFGEIQLPPGESAGRAVGAPGPPLGPIERGGMEPLAPEIAPREPAPSGTTVPETTVPAPALQEPAPVELPTRAGTAIKTMDVGTRAAVSEGAGGEVHLERLGVPAGEIAKPGESGTTLDEIVRRADEHGVPVTTRITPVAGPRGGRIPLERLVPWYEQRGFKLVESTKLPEGQMATATLRREPKPLPAQKLGMLDAQKKMMERAIERPDSPATMELAAPERAPAPGRWHQLNLWADANIASARERIKAREAEFPEQERLRAREAGFAGEKEGHRDPTSYDWADFADRVQVGVNIMLKHGLNKTEWVEHMVRELGGKFRAIADRVYQEALASYNARRPTGNDEARRVVDDYVHGSGLGRGASFRDYPEIDRKFAERVAHAYDQMKNAREGTREWNEAKASYDALNQEIEAQYQAIEKAGFKLEFGEGDPYASSADMRADVAQNRRLRVFKTGESHHPFMTPEQNDKLRAVHDFFGHAAEGYEFGPRGEDAAFRKHASTLSNRAIAALASETRGQNSWVNFMPENAKLPPRERPFAEQKFGLLPNWAWDDVVRAREGRARANELTKGVVLRGPRGADDAGRLQSAARKLQRGVRPVKSPDAVRSRFVSDGTDTVNEMMRVSPESANWYHDDIARMHKLTESELPEVAKPGHQALFDLLLAFTSPNTNVPQNYARAISLMRDFTRSGRVPMLQRFGQEVNMTSRHWVPRLNALIEKHGGDLDAMRDYLLARDPKTGVSNAEKEFGPKVGAFTLNIQGVHDPVTVDVWMVRRLRRLAGTLHRDGALNENWSPTEPERRDIIESVRELSRRTGLDPDAVQAVLWDHEKMVWERAGLMSPRIPFGTAAEKVIENMKARERQIEAAHLTPEQASFFSPLLGESGVVRGDRPAPSVYKQQQKVMQAKMKSVGLPVPPGDVGRSYSGPKSVWITPDGKTFLVQSHERASFPVAKAAKLNEKTSGYVGSYRWDNHALLQRGFIRVQASPQALGVQIVGVPSPAARAALGQMAKGRDVHGVVTNWDGSGESDLMNSLSNLMRAAEAEQAPTKKKAA